MAIDIPTSWQNALGDLQENRWHTILVMGAIDSGKSRFCEFAAHRLLENGFKAAHPKPPSRVAGSR